MLLKVVVSHGSVITKTNKQTWQAHVHAYQISHVYRWTTCARLVGCKPRCRQNATPMEV